ncbi:hypothetical protein J1N35_000547 [Gossypium stocksii]|uniref:Reverse transcriptase zinc-binding domain-containing protein n=1 Tax=Gossypium stocksii TaxID=47602 RepID=A0A9D4AL53_9ROSI|nr:hypothetical protein J1N35_000547 [Gossypium stocksii]
MNFWNDVWIRQLGPLRIFYKGIGQPDDTLRVCELVTKSGSWDWSPLSYLVPDHIVAQITTMLPPSSNACQDRLAQKWMRKYDFSTTATYRNMHAIDDMDSTTIWKIIWKAMTPHRVRVFLWLLWQNKLLMNETSSSLFQPILMCMLLHWSRPKRGWIKLNTDGAVSATNLSSSIGAVFRD